MRPVKEQNGVKGKRKLSFSAVDGHGIPKKQAAVTRRTRSSSNTGNIYLQRSTRSTQKNAFFELPYNYGSRKSSQATESGDITPRRRNKRSSTCSVSSNHSSEELTSPSSNSLTKKWRRHSARLSDSVILPDVKRENITEVNGTSLKENLPDQKTLNSNCNSDTENNAIESNGIEANVFDESNHVNTTILSSSPSKINGESSRANRLNSKVKSFENSSKSLDSLSPKIPAKSIEESDEIKECINGISVACTNAVKCINSIMESRKRHYSENTVTSSPRIRRLSERGEMASVMKYVFQNKISSQDISSPTSKKKKGQPSNKHPIMTNKSNSYNPSVNLQSSNVTDIAKLKQCRVDLKNEETITNAECSSNHCSVNMPHSNETVSNTTSSNLDKAFSPDDVGGTDMKTSARNEAENKNLHNCLKNTENITDSGAEHLSKLKSSQQNSHNKTNGEKVELKTTESSEKDKSQNEHFQVDNFLKWRKRSLRSSGIDCQPDFYALSLDLMIHRSRKSKPEVTENKKQDDTSTNNLQVLSDSELDINKKHSIKSCETSSTTEDLSFDRDSSFIKADAPLYQCNNDIEDSSVNSNHASDCDTSTSGLCDSSNAPFLDTQTSSSLHRAKVRGKFRGRGRGRGRGFGSVRFTPTPPSVEQNPTNMFASSEQDTFEPPPLFDEEPPSGPDVYYFESDHVALKHNQDYHSVLRAASLLESQRKQALHELDILQKRMQEALDDPIAFVEKLQKGEKLELPSQQYVPSLPTVEWSNYTSQFGTFEHVFSGASGSSPSKPFTRRKKINFTSSKPADQTLVKARSETFKKSWSVEEQRKLEELLLKYPQEAVEFNRFRKIAAELGGRTALQVQSRVQKYFIKLAKAGMPIPGRMPRLERCPSAKSRHLHRHRSHHQASLTRISTFFSDFHIPVKMRDEDDYDMSASGAAEEDDGGWEMITSNEQVSDEEDVPEDLRFSDEYLEILRLKRQRKQQLHMFDNKGQHAIARHYGYQCDMCQCEPIEGVRYHCIDCSQMDSVDLCQSCIRSQQKFETTHHKSNHRMEPVYASVVDQSENSHAFSPTTRPYADVDYTKVASSGGEYNYLDPNFLPPTG